MDLIPAAERSRLLAHLQRIRVHKEEWMIVEVKMINQERHSFTTNDAVSILDSVFRDKDGCIMACSDTDILMVVEWGSTNSIPKLTNTIENSLPAASCEVKAVRATSEGLRHISMVLAPTSEKADKMYSERKGRKDALILVADDDLYTRTLIKTGLKGFQITEAADGNKVLEAYLEHNPDMVFLDIHLPGQQGKEVLTKLKTIDPKAFVVMLSADSSAENVLLTKEHGAKGFITKPFTKTRLLEYVYACPTINK